MFQAGIMLAHKELTRNRERTHLEKEVEKHIASEPDEDRKQELQYAWDNADVI